MGAGGLKRSPVKRETGVIKKCLKSNTYVLEAGAAPATVSERGVRYDIAMMRQ